jgi:hypothetical protein
MSPPLPFTNAGCWNPFGGDGVIIRGGVNRRKRVAADMTTGNPILEREGALRVGREETGVAVCMGMPGVSEADGRGWRAEDYTVPFPRSAIRPALLPI